MKLIDAKKFKEWLEKDIKIIEADAQEDLKKNNWGSFVENNVIKGVEENFVDMIDNPKDWDADFVRERATLGAVWHDTYFENPEAGKDVLCVVSGKSGNITYHHSMMIGSYYYEGWNLGGDHKVFTDLIVELWRELPKLPERMEKELESMECPEIERDIEAKGLKKPGAYMEVFEKIGK